MAVERLLELRLDPVTTSFASCTNHDLSMFTERNPLVVPAIGRNSLVLFLPNESTPLVRLGAA